MNYEPEDLEKLGGPCIKALARLAHFWGLTDEEQAQILKTDAQTLESWRARVDAGETALLDLDTITRVGAMLGIFRSLMTLFRADELSVGWLRTPNSSLLFNGRSAIDMMTSDNEHELFDVYRYLKAQVS